MNQRRWLLQIRYEFDELVHAVLQQPQTPEHDLIVARISRCREAIDGALLELDRTEETGYDC